MFYAEYYYHTIRLATGIIKVLQDAIFVLLFAPFPPACAGLRLFWEISEQPGGAVLDVCMRGNGVMKRSPSLLFSFSEAAFCTDGTASSLVGEGNNSSDSSPVFLSSP